jgi:hydrogenase nickel incorporation protein HypB
MERRVDVQTPVLKKNAEYAKENRALFQGRGVTVVNIMSAPGAGKTTLLERVLPLLEPRFRCAVIEGDLQTELDADRIRAVGIPAEQINTTRCHLDAKMIQDAMPRLGEPLDLLVIENIGNLVCPASYDLGEQLRVTLFSVVEGADKPKKYPKMFNQSHCVVLNKIDLIPYTNVSLQELENNVRDVSPEAEVIPLSCRTGEGLDAFVEWLSERIGKSRSR